MLNCQSHAKISIDFQASEVQTEALQQAEAGVRKERLQWQQQRSTFSPPSSSSPLPSRRRQRRCVVLG